VSSAPTGVPSTRNCTPATATSSAALAAISTDPLSVAWAAGAVKATVGTVVSLNTVTTSDACALLPAASRATAVSVCGPLPAVAVLHVTL